MPPSPPRVLSPEEATRHLENLDAEKKKLQEINQEKAKAVRTDGQISAELKIRLERQEAIVKTMKESVETSAAELLKVNQQVARYKELLETKKDAHGEELSHFAQQRIAESLEQAHKEAITREEQYLLDLNSKGLLVDDARLKIVSKEVQELEMKPVYEQQSQDIAAGTAKIMAGYAAHPMFNVANMRKLTGGLAGAFKHGPKDFLKSLATGLLSNFLNSVIGLVFEMNKAESAFTKSTGASKKFKSGMREVYSEVRGAAVSMEQFYQTTGELFKTFTDFTQISKEAQQEVAKVTSTMVQAGHSAGALAKDMQALTIAFGMTATEASDTLIELDAFARDIGVAPAQLTEQFGAMSSGLAKLGSEGVDAFKDLARVSKITGFEMGKLLRMTDKFDTFEGAAEQAGKLNAALGGNFVNAMDMMTATDPVERFEMMRNSLLDAGLEFDNMSYYQRKFFAESMGLDDVSDLAAMMRGDIGSLGAELGQTASDYEAMADRAREAANFQERFQAVLQKLIPIFTPLIDAIDMMLMSVEELGSNTGEFSVEAIEMKGVLDGVFASLKQVGSLVLWVVQNWKTAIAIFVGVKIGLWALTLALGASSMGLVRFALALNLVRAKKMIALGVGFALVALSVAALVLAFNTLDMDHMIGLAATLVLLGVGIKVLAASLAIIGGAAMATWPGLLLIAGLIFTIGASIGLAANGMGLMAEGFALMFNSLSIEKMKALGAFLSMLALSSLSSTAAALGLGIVAVGLAALWISMALMPTTEINAFTKFLTSLENLTDFTNLDLALTKIQGIKKAVSGMPSSSIVAVTGMMTAMAAPAMVAAARATALNATVKQTNKKSSNARDTSNQNVPIQATIPIYLDGKLLTTYTKNAIAKEVKRATDAYLQDNGVCAVS